MSNNDQTLLLIETNSSPMFKLDMILESNLGKILDPTVSDPSKADAARTIVKVITDAMPKRHLAANKSDIQAAVQRLQETIVLDALGAVQDWAGDRLLTKKQDAGSIEVGKQVLRWLNSRATNLDFVITSRASPD